jgi:hypothetical protein
MIRLSIKTPSALSYLRSILLAHLCCLQPVAFGDEAKEEFQKAVSAQISDTVNRDVESFFRQLDIQEPVKVETATEADVDTTGAVPRVTLIRLNVNIVTDQPSQVVRQARHRLVRLLREQGYRFDSSEGAPGEARPLAVLNIQTTPPPPTQTDSEQTWVYAGFAALILALLSSVLTLLYVLFLPWIRWYRAKKRQATCHPTEVTQEPTVQDLPVFPFPPSSTIPSNHEPHLASSTELPPLPQVGGASATATPKPQNHGSSIDLGGWSTLSKSDA